ncbi:MAG TPA: ATP-binding protein, partial [Vicinamibacterales bacterium]|nr:ATP-binding protein [Vicinamibacterales bacterium]
RKKLLAALFLIAVVFVVQGAVNAVLARRAEAEAQGIYSNSLTSIIAVARIARDVDQQRIVVDDHVFESAATQMEADERRLAEIRKDIRTASSVYEPLTDLPNEARIWREAQASLARFDAITDEAIRLSRKNLDAEARARMTRALGDYGDLNRLLDELVQLNRTGAREARDRVRALQQKTEAVQLTTRLIGLALLLLVGWWGVREIAEYERQVGTYAAELEQRNRDLDAFAGRVAHDLKNVLGPVMMAPGALRRSSSDPARVREVAEMTERCAHRAEAVIDALLAFSRASVARGSHESGSIRAAVGEVVEELTPVAARLDVTLRVEHLAGVDVACQPGLLHILLANLCGNAVKFLEGQPERSVRISARVEALLCRIDVEDTGPGIPRSAQDHLFDPFYRVEGTRAPGTGIGLATARRIVDSRGGRIAVRSTPGRGSCFSVWLPLAPPHQRLEDRESKGTRQEVSID